MRPRKRFKVKRNADSLQFYDDGDYCGSLAIKELCQLAREKLMVRHKVGSGTKD